MKRVGGRRDATVGLKARFSKTENAWDRPDGASRIIGAPATKNNFSRNALNFKN
jgi:hypothetical protein